LTIQRYRMKPPQGVDESGCLSASPDKGLAKNTPRLQGLFTGAKRLMCAQAGHPCLPEQPNLRKMHGFLARYAIQNNWLRCPAYPQVYGNRADKRLR
jgi:hypothetical protein